MFFLVSLSSSAGNVHALKLQADVSDYFHTKTKRGFFLLWACLYRRRRCCFFRCEIKLRAAQLSHLCCSSVYLSPWPDSSSCAAFPSVPCRCRWSRVEWGRLPWLPARRSWAGGGSPVPAPASRSGVGSTLSCPSCRNDRPWSGSCCKWCTWSSSGGTRSRALASPSLRPISRGGNARTSARRTFWNRHTVKTPHT